MNIEKVEDPRFEHEDMIFPEPPAMLVGDGVGVIVGVGVVVGVAVSVGVGVFVFVALGIGVFDGVLVLVVSVIYISSEVILLQENRNVKITTLMITSIDLIIFIFLSQLCIS